MDQTEFKKTNLENKEELFSPIYFDKFQKEMMKYKIISLKNYKNLISFFEEESIILDEENLMNTSLAELSGYIRAKR